MNQWNNLSQEESIRNILQARLLEDDGSVNARMNPELVSCSEDGQSCILRFPCKPSMRNPMGWVHGGVVSTMMDISMGLLACYSAGGHVCATISMNINFVRPTQIDGALLCRATMIHRGHRLVQLRCECWKEDRPDRITAHGSGDYIIKEHAKRPHERSGSGMLC